MEQRPDETEQRQVPTHHQHQQPQPHEDEEEFFVPTDRRGLKRYWALETATIAPLTPDQVCAYIHVVYTHLAASSGYFLRALRYVWFEWFGMREARIRWIRVLLELRVAPEREKIGCVSIVIGMRCLVLNCGCCVRAAFRVSFPVVGEFRLTERKSGPSSPSNCAPSLEEVTAVCHGAHGAGPHPRSLPFCFFFPADGFSLH